MMFGSSAEILEKRAVFLVWMTCSYQVSKSRLYGIPLFITKALHNTNLLLSKRRSLGVRFQDKLLVVHDLELRVIKKHI